MENGHCKHSEVCNNCKQILCQHCVEDCAGCAKEFCEVCFAGHLTECVQCKNKLCPKEGIIIGEVATPTPKGSEHEPMMCPMCDSLSEIQTEQNGGDNNGNMA